MKAVFFVLNNADLLSRLLAKLSDNGIKGGTIIDSNGMGRELAQADEFKANFGSLRALLNPALKNTKTLIFVVAEEKLALLTEVIESVVGNLDQPGTGILFALPIDFIKGLKL